MTVEHPEIRFVSNPVRWNTNEENGDAPRMRHLVGCSHFKSGGVTYGEPIEATPEQMAELPACGDCIKTEFGAADEDELGQKAKRYGSSCPTCGDYLGLTGRCDNCG